MAAIAPQLSRVGPEYGPEPGRPPKRKGKLTVEEDYRLITKLEAFCDRWESGEGDRRRRDERGFRMFRGSMLDDHINESRLEVSSNTPLALFERVVADVLRGSPEPEIEAQDPDEEDAARVAEGAIRTNWRNTRMREKMANGYRLAGFTRAIGCYHYWRHELHGGIGDVDKRFIPGHRLIADDSTPYVADMQFVGFEEEMSRATLITLFPESADEIEAAAESSTDRLTGINRDPLRTSSPTGPGGKVVDRLISAADGSLAPPFKSATSVPNRGGKKGKADPLSEKVTVRFLWIDDKSPTREQRPKLDPRSKRPMYEVERDETGRIVMEDGEEEVIQTPLGPQYVTSSKPKFRIAMEDCIVRKYKYRRHVAYIKNDKIKLWDVAWNGPVPISILRDRYPAHGFDAPGSALRLQTLGVARSVIWTIILKRLKKSLAGTWIANAESQLKKNTLANEIGSVWYVRGDVNAAVKEFPQAPVDAAYFGLLDKAEAEMELLIGVTPTMKGQALGRADSPGTYEQVEEQSGGPTLDRAKQIDQFVQDAVEIDLWFMQENYTHEHTVEVVTAEGFSTWLEASALTIRGKFAVRVETGSSLGSSVARDRKDAQDGAQAGFYALPMMGRLGKYKHWRQGLKQKGAIMAKGPQYAYLLGPAGAPPQTQAQNIRSQGQRSHHKPGGK